MKTGVTVQIGLDKTVRLEKVFQRYVEFCNEQHPSEKIELGDIEFVHSHVLSGHDTAEAAALMKNDRLSVRPEASDARKEEEERHKRQRESDKDYFSQIRQLLPTQTFSGRHSVHPVDMFADVMFDCRGPIPIVSGLPPTPDSSQNLIRAHSFLIHKRCPRLGALIIRAKEEHVRRSVVTVPEEGKQEESEAEDEGFQMLQGMKEEKQHADASSAAAQIENDDDEQPLNPEVVRSASRRRHSLSGDEDDDEASFASAMSLPVNLPTVVIEDYPPEAVKLLLEYCYTNRVVPLGYDAFMKAAKSKEEHVNQFRKGLHGPVAPFSYRPTRWPSAGEPVVSFAVALAGIRLAEEFEMPRLSLMCEVAAAALVDQNSAMDALQECEKQRCLTGNELPRLRKEAMSIVLRCCAVGGGAAAVINTGLETRGRLIVPTLFTGTMEAVKKADEKKKTKHHSGKRDWQRMALSYFDNYDRHDLAARERERRKRKDGEDPNVDSDDDEGDFCWGEAKARNQSLKRMSKHFRPGDILGLNTRSRKTRRTSS